jgi:hypothetical protein
MAGTLKQINMSTDGGGAARVIRPAGNPIVPAAPNASAMTTTFRRQRDDINCSFTNARRGRRTNAGSDRTAIFQYLQRG